MSRSGCRKASDQELCGDDGAGQAVLRRERRSPGAQRVCACVLSAGRGGRIHSPRGGANVSACLGGVVEEHAGETRWSGART